MAHGLALLAYAVVGALALLGGLAGLRALWGTRRE